MDIAIIAMDCRLPGSDSAQAWIDASRSGAPALSTVPPGRWPRDPASMLRPGTIAADSTPTLRGGFVALPDASEPGDTDIERLVHAAVASVVPSGARERTDLVLANLSLPTSGMVRAASEPYSALVDGEWLNGGSEHDLRHGESPALSVARRLGLGGHVCALDAACASGLYAVQLAADRLRAGLCDVAIAAAVQLADSAFLFMGFAQLRALSGTGHARPFDSRADGLLIGEGVAAVALKRLADAQADGDVIHAIIRSGGLGNDGRKGNLLAPSATGQERALRQAYEAAGIAPHAVGYAECHATGTRLGDRTELDTLAAVHTNRTTPLVVSSTKGQIGHTITVAGLAGLIRAAGAVRDGFMPPTPGCEQPWPEHADTLTPLSSARVWTDDQRIAAVSAFGFGGTNAHVLVANTPSPEHVDAPTAPTCRTDVVGIGARFGGAATTRSSLQQLREATTASAPADIRRGTPLPDGVYMPSVRIDPVSRRVPPSEAAQVLPQQWAMLEAAADALSDADIDRSRTASIIGMTVDPQIAEHTLRWCTAHPDAVSPPLTSARVQGVLPNLVANRIAATFDLQGPSYTVSSGADSLHTAIAHAERLLATGVVDAVLVGAVDLPGHVANRPTEAVCEAAVALLLVADADAPLLTVHATPPTARHHDRIGHAGAADSAIALLLDSDLDAIVPHTTDRASRGTLAIPHDTGLPLQPAWLGTWDTDTVPLANPHAASPGVRAAFAGGAPLVGAALSWRVETPQAPAPAPAPPTPVAPAVPAARPRTPIAAALQPTAARELAELGRLAAQMAETTRATARAHSAFLASQARATEQIARLADAFGGHDLSLRSGTAPMPATAVQRAPTVRPAPTPPPVPFAPAPAAPPPAAEDAPLIDRAGLEHLAHGTLSKVLGAAYADLDDIAPRVRLPMGELLLVSRVTSVEGSRGPLGPARMTTEYDLPEDASWVHQGKPPPCVVVESGQADLLLCAILGTDAITRGKALYRLLDCDLTFHGDRPSVGETLCHDIRIKAFARMGETILFYFEYDCTAKSDGRPVLTMREGCAGFFTPASLAVPQGVDPTPKDRPSQKSLVPLFGTPPTSLDDDAVAALTRGEYATALGSAFSPADDAALRLPSGKWSLLDRVETLTIAGGPHGLGRVVAHQDLRDDDWFNAVHFKDDPCMPGTLMFDGCTQALSVWLMAHGFPARFPDATFEPVADIATKLRCRGQVVPGHSRLTYDVRPTRAGMDPTPWVVADVILFVDGTPVVLAEDVSLCIRGEAVDLPEPTTFSEVQHLEFSIGDPSRAFGPNWAQYDEGPRTPRMPGPPLLMLSRATAIDAPKEQLTAPASVTMECDIAPDAWWWAAAPDSAMPLAILLEIALQPCGWLTAWQGAALGKGDLYFRNLGGTATWHTAVLPDAGVLTTTAKLVSTSSSGGMTLVFFEMQTYCGDVLVLSGDTHFGYFTERAIAEQKGLGLDDEDRRAALRDQHAVDIAVEHPRDDLRMLDRITARCSDFVSADKANDPSEWFFTAHFHQDPVMPGSLGLDGLAQLARWELEQRVGAPDGIVEPVASGSTLSWRYRGQVNRSRDALQYELDITDVTLGDEPTLTANGVVRADGMAIYELTGLAVRFAHAPEAVEEPLTRPAPHSALLDELIVDRDTAVGRLRLDPAVHPWLHDHAPTLVIPAVPMAFAAEIAAEAARALHPDGVITGLPQVQAESWIHTADGPRDLLVTAIRDGDHVAVTLALHHDNPKFPALSGPKVHMRAVVALADAWPEAPAAPGPLADGEPMSLSARDYYDGGLTFHGPVLQAVQTFHERSATAIRATFRTRPDADLLPPDSPAFVLDPLLLDAATHPMFSGSPELWNADIGPGKLAYPVRCDDLRLYGPRPTGEVQCHLTLVQASRELLVFDVTLTGTDSVWATFRWSEALVAGGPVLGAGADAVATFAKGHQPADVHVGRPTEDGWAVSPGDLVEPIPGTLLRLLGRPAEVRTALASDDVTSATTALLACKEAVRAHLVAHLGRDVHPTSLRLVQLRPDRWVVAEATTLTAQEFIDHLAATRFTVRCRTQDGTSVAQVVSLGVSRR